MTESELSHVVAEAQQRNPAAFEKLYQFYYPSVSPQHINFLDNELIEAGRDQGMSSVIQEAIKKHSKSIIKIRTDFYYELLKSAEII